MLLGRQSGRASAACDLCLDLDFLRLLQIAHELDLLEDDREGVFKRTRRIDFYRGRLVDGERAHVARVERTPQSECGLVRTCDPGGRTRAGEVGHVTQL